MEMKEFAEKVEEVKKALAEEQRVKGYRLDTSFLKFTDKEIERMPKSFVMHFAVRGLSPYAYVSTYVKDNSDGLTATIFYEVFYRVNGDYVVAVAETLAKAKSKFICALCIDEAKRHK